MQFPMVHLELYNCALLGSFGKSAAAASSSPGIGRYLVRRAFCFFFLVLLSSTAHDILREREAPVVAGVKQTEFAVRRNLMWVVLRHVMCEEKVG